MISIALIAVLLLILTAVVGAGNAVADSNELVVDQAGDGEYETIQNAVNDSSPGDTIVVKKGVYEEEVLIDVEDVAIVAADGETPVLDGGSTHNTSIAIEAGADAVTIDGLEVRNYDLSEEIGPPPVISVEGDDVELTNLTVSETIDASEVIRVDGDGAVLTNVTASENTDASQVIQIDGHGATVSESVITNNTGSGSDAGIRVDGNEFLVENSTLTQNNRGLYILANDVAINDNKISANDDRGIFLHNSHRIEITRNTINDNAAEGIREGNNQEAADVTISKNTITGNGGTVGTIHGVRLVSGGNTTVTDNVVSENVEGIAVGDDSIVVNNTLSDNTAGGFGSGGISTGADSVVKDNEITDVSRTGIETHTDSHVVNNSVDIPGSRQSGTIGEPSGISIDANTVVTENDVSIGETAAGLTIDNTAVNTTITNNTFENGVYLSGSELPAELVDKPHTMENNLVNGKPLYYASGETNPNIDREAAQIILVNVTDANISGIEFGGVVSEVQIAHSENVDVVDNEVTDSGPIATGTLQPSIAIWETSDATVMNNELGDDIAPLVDDKSGIHISKSENVLIVENEIVGEKGEDDPAVGAVDDSGINLVSSEAVTIRHNRVSGFTEGAKITDAGDTTVDGNVFDRNYVGIDFYNVSHLTAEKNTIEDSTGPGIVGGGSDGFELSDNRVTESEAYGIELSDVSDGDRSYVTDNKVSANQEGGLYLSPSGSELKNVIVAGNEIEDNAENGLTLNTAVDNVTVTHNVIAENEVGIQYDGEPVLNATANWWGDRSGPSGSVTDPETGELADGDGDSITEVADENVNFDPWLLVDPRDGLGFVWDPQTPDPGEETTFEAAHATVPADDIVEYRWDFTGDGTVDKRTSEPEATWAYDETDTYDVSLTVEMSDGETETDERSVSVFEIPEECAEFVTEGESIQDAINGTEDGGTVCVDAGVYEEDLEITQSVELRGVAGDEQPVLEGTGDQFATVYVNHANDVTIDGFEVANDDWMYGVYGDGVNHMSVRNVTADIENGWGIGFFESENVEVRDSYLENLWMGIGHWEAGSIAVENTHVTDSTYGIELYTGYEGEEAIIADSAFTDNDETGIWVSNGTAEFADGVSVTNTTIDGNEAGLTNDADGGVVEATGNWWGHGSGPSGDVEDPETETVADGSGDSVTDGVSFDPWLRIAPGEDIAAAFTVDPAKPEVEQPISFDASDSVSTGEIVEYRWDFTGDGTIDERTSDPETTWTFDEGNVYDVTLTVEDDAGETAETTAPIDVEEPIPELEVEEFSEEFPDGEVEDDYGEVEITVTETADVETENLEVELAVMYLATEQVLYEDVVDDRELQSGSDTFTFDLGSFPFEGSYLVNVAVTADNAENTWESTQFELEPPEDAPTGTIDLEEPIDEDQESFEVTYSFENTTDDDAEVVVGITEPDVIRHVEDDGSFHVDVDDIGGIQTGDQIRAEIWDEVPDFDEETVTTERESVQEPLDWDSTVVEGDDDEPAEFEVSDVEPADATVGVGEPFDVSATIENVGGETGEKDVELRLDGSTIKTEEAVELGSSESTTVVFEDVSVEEAGEYDLTVWTEDDDATVPVTVTEPTEPEPEFRIIDSDLQTDVSQAHNVTVPFTIKNVGGSGTQTVNFTVYAPEEDDDEDDDDPRTLERVAVVDDERDTEQGEEIASLLEPHYDTVETVDNTNLLDEMDDYDAFVIFRFNDTTLAADFHDELDDDQGVVYLDSHQGASAEQYPDGVYRLHQLRGDPAQWDSESIGTDANPAVVEITEDHPIFEDVGEEGDTVVLNEDTSSWGSWFDDYSGDIIADVDYSPSDSGEIAGPGIAVNDDENEVLLSALSYDFFAESSDITDEGETVLVNAVEYAGPESGAEPTTTSQTEEGSVDDEFPFFDEEVLRASTEITLETNETFTSHWTESERLEYEVPANLAPDLYTQELSTESDSEVSKLRVEQTQADIEVREYSLNPDPEQEELVVGETITADVLVTNHGDRAGEFEVLFYVGEEVVDNQTVTVDADTTKEVDYEFDHELREARTKILSINGIDPVRVEVSDEEPEPEPRDPASFELNLDTDASTLNVTDGERAVLVGEVTNTGDRSGSQELTAGVTETRASEHVRLRGGETTTVELAFTADLDDDGESAFLASDDERDTTPLTVVPPDPANFTVTIDENASTLDVFEEENVTLVTDVTNDGDVEGTQKLTAGVGDERTSENLTLDGGETETVDLSFATTIDDDGASAVVESANDSDAATMNVSIPEPANFTVTIDENASTLDVLGGESVVVVGNVSNVGETQSTQTVELTDDGTVIGSETVELDRNATTGIEFEWNTTGVSTGERELIAETDNATDTAPVWIRNHEPERSIAEHNLTRGETTTVSVTAAFAEPTNFTVVDAVDGFDDVVIVDDDGATFANVTDRNDELFATFDERERATIVVEATVSDDSAPGLRTFDGFVEVEAEDEQSSIVGDDTVDVPVEETAPPERSIDDGVLAPGDSTTVTLTVTLDEPTNFTIVEEMDAFETVEIVDDDGADFSEVTTANDELFATYTDRAQATVVVEVTIPESAEDGELHTFDGIVTVGGSETAVGGDDLIDIIAAAEEPNVAHSEDATIVFDEDTGSSQVEFSDDSTVESIEFATAVEGEANVTDFDGEPEDVDELPGSVVSLTQITVPDEATDSNATIRKQVSIDQIEETGIAVEELQIHHYSDGEWHALDTDIVEETGTTVVLEAETEGFSYFAVGESGETDDEDTPWNVSLVVVAVIAFVAGLGYVARRRAS